MDQMSWNGRHSPRGAAPTQIAVFGGSA